MSLKLNIKFLRKNKKTTIIPTEESLKDIEPWFSEPLAPYPEPYPDNYTTNDEYVNGDYDDSNK